MITFKGTTVKRQAIERILAEMADSDSDLKVELTALLDQVETLSKDSGNRILLAGIEERASQIAQECIRRDLGDPRTGLYQDLAIQLLMASRYMSTQNLPGLRASSYAITRLTREVEKKGS